MSTSTLQRGLVRWLVGVLLIGGCDDTTQVVGARADATDVADTGAADVADAGDVALEAGDTARDGSGPAEVVEPPLDGIVAMGRFYRDERGWAQSAWVQRSQPEAAGVAEVEVTLLTPGAPARRVVTDEDGGFGFGGLEAGRHLLLFDPGDDGLTCTSNNMPRRFAEAMREGEVTIVSFGDSVPHWGPTPWFPARLETILDTFAETEDVNIAVPGSTSVDWLPGGVHHTRLMREVATADLAVFSLGGNDVTFYLSDFVEVDPAELLENIDYYLGLLDGKIIEISENLKDIISSVRAVNPEIDIVWFVYPNYAWNDYWAPYLGEWAPFVRPLLDERLDTIRFLMSRSGILLADMHAAIPGPEVAGLMVDELHLNAAGHARYAEELFMLLGGVTVGEGAGEHRGLTRAFGLD